MDQNLKVLISRRYFRNGELVTTEGPTSPSLTVFLIEPGRELGLGFAKIANHLGEARFRMVQDFDGNVEFTKGETLPCVSLNDEVITTMRNSHFNLGDTLYVRYSYEEPLFIAEDMVTLLPDSFPASVKA